MSAAKHLALVGISHHRSPVELRELVAVDADGARALVHSLAGEEREVACLSTCNRTELVLARADVGGAEREAVEALVGLAGVPEDELTPALYLLRDEAAALHLFRVAAGLDSLVPGEGEILGQVRAAYEAAAGGPVLDRLFRQALHAGRAARTHTSIGEQPASVPAAAAALAEQVFGKLAGRGILLVGAGRTSELAARNLLSRGASISFVASRTLARAEGLAGKIGAAAIPLERVPAVLESVDVAVFSTSAPAVVLHRDGAARATHGRRGSPLLLLDLAVPRDVDPAVHELPECYLYDIDDLEAVVAESLSARRGEAVRAEAIVAEEAQSFSAWQASLEVVPAITQLRSRAEAIRTRELAKVEGRLGGLSEHERRAVESLTSQIVNKLLHVPTMRMKQAAAAADGVVYAETVRHLFGLEDEG